MLESQMKVRNAKEQGICSIREELISECLDELIRQITINCLQRGDLLNSIKDQINEVINYYQKLYESCMAFEMRKVLIDQKKKKKLLNKSENLQGEINNLEQVIRDKEQEFEDKIRE